MSAAMAARTSADLAPLFADLPSADGTEHLPALAEPPSPTQLATKANSLPTWVMALNGIAWPAAIIFNFATDWNYWWVILIPALLMPSLMGAFGGGKAPRDRQRSREIDQ